MEMKEILERMHGQKLYFCNDETLMKEQAACLEILYDFNQTRPGEGEKRTALLRQLLAEVGENVYIEPPLRANWAGTPISAGTCTPTSTSPWWTIPISISGRAP